MPPRLSPGAGFSLPKTVRLRDDQLATFEAINAETGQSISQVVRKALDLYYSTLGRVAADSGERGAA